MKAICQICEKELHFVNDNHLWTHNVMLKDYKLRFPNAELCSDELKENRRQRFLKNNPVYRKECRDKMGRTHHEIYKKDPSHWKKLGKINGARNKGTKYPKSHREAISKALMGHGFSEETLEKMRGARPSMLRENNPNWRGGKSFEPYGLDFNNELREEARTQATHECFLCKTKQSSLKRQLAIHHIDYNKKNNKIENLIALCVICHGKTHYNRQKWIEFLKTS